MNFDLSSEHCEIQQEAKNLASKIEPLAAQADELSVVHPTLKEMLRESGLVDLMVTTKYGGRTEQLDPLSICLVREVLAGTSCQLDSLFAMQGIGSFAITEKGSINQCEKWLPNVRSLDSLAALALTEPDAGSDLKSIITEIHETNSGFLLSGAKSWISNAGAASFYLVFVRDGGRFTMVIVPAESKGLRVTPCPEIISPHVLGEVTFDDVNLPADCIIGERGAALDLVLATLGTFRVSVAGAAVGLADAALQEAIMHTSQRKQFGRPLAKLGAVEQMLADCWTEIEMIRLLTYRAAQYAAIDPLESVHHSSMAKLAATEAASKIVDRCSQVMGRFGLARGTKMERLYRQARPMRIYEGASEVLRVGITRKLIEERTKN